uniref:G-protein coupled receptors family 1 profile domain-containing protein n=1 Tax=Scleropages formosus TaxID=113540 RepID=A0A8C9UZ05_SCLFO
MQQIKEQVFVVQVLVGIFLYVNSFLIFTFFQKQIFYTTTRYILFAHSLICDWVFLFMTDLLLLFTYFLVTMPAGLCVLICVIMIILTFSTPLTLTAMSVERYVAICLPLRHAELCIPHRAGVCILIIQALSIIQSVIVLPIFIASVPLSFFSTQRICSVEMIVVHKWQSHLKSASAQFYFLVMSVAIIFTYVKIMEAAKMASTKNKQSISKGLKTVILHGFQLCLSLIQLWFPFVEVAVMDISLGIYVKLRYFDYVVGVRCPLIYGLRDHHFCIVLKYYLVKCFHCVVIIIMSLIFFDLAHCIAADGTLSHSQNISVVF